jgi:hypothetical protein
VSHTSATGGASGRPLTGGAWVPGLGAFAVACLACLACSDGKDGKVGEVVGVSTEIAGEEDDLLSRRDALLLSREQLRERRAELSEQRRQIREAGGDTSAVDEQADQLLEQERRLVEEEQALNTKYEEIIRQRRAMMDVLASGGGEAAQVAARESGIASREKELARREDRLAQREDTLAERERRLALRERETCGVAPAPATIIQTVDAKGSSYTRRDVDPLLRRARSEMNRKGILPADLPSPAQGLEREATRAMKEGDFGRARFAASQLVATVSSMAIDRGFIQAKIGRLSAAMKGVSLEAAKQKEVDDLFKGATADYGDGKFTSANRRLNRIYAIIN